MRTSVITALTLAAAMTGCTTDGTEQVWRLELTQQPDQAACPSRPDHLEPYVLDDGGAYRADDWQPLYDDVVLHKLDHADEHGLDYGLRINDHIAEVNLDERWYVFLDQVDATLHGGGSQSQYDADGNQVCEVTYTIEGTIKSLE